MKKFIIITLGLVGLLLSPISPVNGTSYAATNCGTTNPAVADTYTRYTHSYTKLPVLANDAAATDRKVADVGKASDGKSLVSRFDDHVELQVNPAALEKGELKFLYLYSSMSAQTCGMTTVTVKVKPAYPVWVHDLKDPGYIWVGNRPNTTRAHCVFGNHYSGAIRKEIYLKAGEAKRVRMHLPVDYHCDLPLAHVQWQWGTVTNNK